MGGGSVILLSVDPGDRVGYALWDDGECYENAVVTRSQFMEMLTNGYFEGTDRVVAEDFALFRGRAQKQVGSKMPASLVLGALELWCRQRGIWLTKQHSGILSIAAKHANRPLPAGHCPDDLSAYLHGYYYLEGIGDLQPVQREL